MILSVPNAVDSQRGWHILPTNHSHFIPTVRTINRSRKKKDRLPLPPNESMYQFCERGPARFPLVPALPHPLRPHPAPLRREGPSLFKPCLRTQSSEATAPSSQSTAFAAATLYRSSSSSLSGRGMLAAASISLWYCSMVATSTMAVGGARAGAATNSNVGLPTSLRASQRNGFSKL
jgi:hypothetical protein